MSSKTISLEDDLAIRNLMGKYQWLVDGGSDDWVNCFTPDGGFVGGLPEPYHGHARLKEIPKLVREHYQDKMRHHIGSFWTEYGNTKDEAYARYYALVTTWMKDQGPQFFQMSLCTVHLVRVNSEWKIKTNNVKNLKE